MPPRGGVCGPVTPGQQGWAPGARSSPTATCSSCGLHRRSSSYEHDFLWFHTLHSTTWSTEFLPPRALAVPSPISRGFRRCLQPPACPRRSFFSFAAARSQTAPKLCSRGRFQGPCTSNVSSSHFVVSRFKSLFLNRNEKSQETKCGSR